MPNWCQNTLVVVALKQKDLNSFIKQAEYLGDDGLHRPLCLGSLIKPSDDVVNGEEHKWIKWSRKNWGVHREILRGSVNLVKKGKVATYQFNTAWDAPVAWLEKVAEMFPRLHFSLSYYEPGMGFAGKFSIVYGDDVIEDMEVKRSSDNETYVDIVTEHLTDKDIEEYAWQNIKMFALDEWEYTLNDLVRLSGEDYRSSIESQLVIKILEGKINNNEPYCGADIKDIVDSTVGEQQFINNVFRQHKSNGELKMIAAM